jgi:roadblock/LC7 domain-containing protein
MKKNNMNIDDFKSELERFMEKALIIIANLLKLYGCKTVEELEIYKVEKGIKCLYPRVYYARLKNGRHGVTLPSVYTHGGSAIDLPKDMNSLAWAICFALKVEEVLKAGNYTYFEWVRSHGWLSHGVDAWAETGHEYIRLNKNGQGYLVYRPVTGKGYVLVSRTKDDPSYPTLEAAIYKRNQVLYSLVKSGEEWIDGKKVKVPADRLKKFRRILCKGYFEAISPTNVKREYLASAFRNSADYCEDDETLKKAMRFFGSLAAGKITKDSKSLKFALKNMRVIREYFAAIELNAEVVRVFKNTAYDDLAKLGVKPVDKRHQPMTNKDLEKAVADLRKHWNCKY